MLCYLVSLCNVGNPFCLNRAELLAILVSPSRAITRTVADIIYPCLHCYFSRFVVIYYLTDQSGKPAIRIECDK